MKRLVSFFLVSFLHSGSIVSVVWKYLDAEAEVRTAPYHGWPKTRTMPPLGSADDRILLEGLSLATPEKQGIVRRLRTAEGE